MHNLQRARTHMSVYFPHTHIDNTINIAEIGYSSPNAGYSSKSQLFNGFTIHYLVTGKGTYAETPISGPCIFVRFPLSPHRYTVNSSPDSPKWEQYWIRFSGPSSKEFINYIGISEDSPIAPCNYINQVVDTFKSMTSSFSHKSSDNQLAILSVFFKLLSLHLPQSSDEFKKVSNYTLIVCNYIHEHYANITNEKELANLVHISVNHLGRVFKADTDITPLQYLTKHRIKCAMDLLSHTDLPIAIISESVGFSNPNYFCNVFKKHCNNISPKVYRENVRRTADT